MLGHFRPDSGSLFAPQPGLRYPKVKVLVGPAIECGALAGLVERFGEGLAVGIEWLGVCSDRR